MVGYGVLPEDMYVLAYRLQASLRAQVPILRDYGSSASAYLGDWFVGKRRMSRVVTDFPETTTSPTNNYQEPSTSLTPFNDGTPTLHHRRQSCRRQHLVNRT